MAQRPWKFWKKGGRRKRNPCPMRLWYMLLSICISRLLLHSDFRKIIFRFFYFDQWNLTLILSTLILSPYKPELSMIRSCPDRLEFKTECYSTVNQSISKRQRYLH
jgi:hypothetical protein